MFNNKISDNEKFIRTTLLKLIKFAKKGLAFNLISNYVNYRDKELYYASPEEIFSFCKKLSRYVVLRHDYMPFDFTIYIYKKRDWGI